MNIGFYAMSGIRACDAELLRLGLTLPGFVERSKTIASLPSLGLLTLAGMTPERHARRYVEVDDVDALGELPRDLDLVAISSFSAQVKEAYELARRFRAIGTPVVIGGLHVTSLPDEPQRHGAIAAVGEGEPVWGRILADAERGRLQSVYRAGDHDPREFDLADSPMPAFELLDIDRYNRLTVQTSRGCPWRCTFCASSILLTRRYKQKPIERVLAEVDRIRELWPRPFLELADDNAFVNRAYWKELLPRLERRRVRWFAETDLSLHEDEDFLRALARSGCKQVLIGFESPVQAGLDGVEMRRNWKLARFPVYREAVRRIQSHGIRVNACFVVGLDGHTTRVFDDVYEFVESARPFDVQITYPTPFPGTPLHDSLKRQGRLTHEGAWERCTLFDINFRPSHMSAEELRDGFFDLTRRLYSESFTRWRREGFHEQVRAAARRRGRAAVRGGARHAASRAGAATVV